MKLVSQPETLSTGSAVLTQLHVIRRAIKKGFDARVVAWIIDADSFELLRAHAEKLDMLGPGGTLYEVGDIPLGTSAKFGKPTIVAEFN